MLAILSCPLVWSHVSIEEVLPSPCSEHPSPVNPFKHASDEGPFQSAGHFCIDSHQGNEFSATCLTKQTGSLQAEQIRDAGFAKMQHLRLRTKSHTRTLAHTRAHSRDGSCPTTNSHQHSTHNPIGHANTTSVFGRSRRPT